MAEMHVRRSLLFVPANRPQLFAKALSGPADMVCIELEDGVGPDQKQAARAHMLSFLNRQTHFHKPGQRLLCASIIPIQMKVRPICRRSALRPRFPPG